MALDSDTDWDDALEFHRSSVIRPLGICVSGSTHKAMRIFNLSTVLVSLLVLTSGCAGTPSSTDTTAPRTPESVAAQHVAPRTPLASIQLPAEAQAAPQAPT